RALIEGLLSEPLTHQRRQELVHDDPLDGPSRVARGVREELQFGNARAACAIDERIVQLQNREMKLRYEHMRVVARVADQRETLGVPRHITALIAKQTLRRIVPFKEEWMTDRAVTVHTLEIQAGCARILQSQGVDMNMKRRPIGGDVVCDELSEDRPA